MQPYRCMGPQVFGQAGHAGQRWPFAEACRCTCNPLVRWGMLANDASTHAAVLVLTSPCTCQAGHAGQCCPLAKPCIKPTTPAVRSGTQADFQPCRCSQPQLSVTQGMQASPAAMWIHPTPPPPVPGSHADLCCLLGAAKVDHSPPGPQGHTCCLCCHSAIPQRRTITENHTVLPGSKAAVVWAARLGTRRLGSRCWCCRQAALQAPGHRRLKKDFLLGQQASVAEVECSSLAKFRFRG